jgi:hypothetical protein
VSPLAFPLGLLLGMALIPRALHWALLAHTTFAEHSGDFLGPPRRRLLWMGPLALLFHPVPYLLVGIVVASLLAALGRLEAGWLWFLGGFYAYAALLSTFIFRFLRRQWRARAARKT